MAGAHRLDMVTVRSAVTPTNRSRERERPGPFVIWIYPSPEVIYYYLPTRRAFLRIQFQFFGHLFTGQKCVQF